ncbi:MAG: hypothetical protein GX322_08705 [Firmicutes bacterium]|nr:hypothetical protein [Bacillota bacterium]
MSIPKALWAIVCHLFLTDAGRAFLTSDFMSNVYFLAVVILLGVAWRRWAWLRQLTDLYREHYYWIEENVQLPGNLKLGRYMEKLNEAIVELRGSPMTDHEIKMAKLTADGLAAKDHMSGFYR